MLTSKPSKQRRMLHQAPDHVRYKMFGAPLSDPLIASQGVRTLPVRTGDTIRVMRGDHKGFEGKVSRVNRKEYRVYVEGLTREKVDGTAIFVALHPSKIMITNLNLDDKWRKHIIERKKGVEKKEKAKPAPKRAPTKEKAKVKEAPQQVAPYAETKEKIKEPAKEEITVRKEPKKKVTRPRKPTAKRRTKEETVKEPKEEKPLPKPKKARAKRRTGEKSEGGA